MKRLGAAAQLTPGHLEQSEEVLTKLWLLYHSETGRKKQSIVTWWPCSSQFGLNCREPGAAAPVEGNPHQYTQKQFAQL
jgi:hypothetical protein